MRKANVFVNKNFAGVLEEITSDQYRFSYDEHYKGRPISLTMPTKKSTYEFNRFPPFFEGLLPEGVQLEILLRKYKLDKHDYFGQLLQVGKDVVGAITIEEMK